VTIGVSGDLFGSVRVGIDGTTELSLAGDVDTATTSRFSTFVGAAIATSPARLVIDLAGVSYMGACALPVLESSAARLAAHGGHLVLRHVPPAIQRLLDAVGLDESIQIEQLATDAAVVRHLSSGGIPLERQVLDAALTLVVVMAQAVVRGADGVSITLPRHGRMGTVAASDGVVLQMDHDQYDTGQGPCLDAAHTGEFFCSDFLDEEERWPDFVPRARARGIECVMSSPLLVEKRAVGALNVYSRTRRAFAVHESAWAAQFASQAAKVVAVTLPADSEAQNSDAVREFADALESRQSIAIAQGILVGRYGGTVDAAYELLRETSVSTGRPLRALCEELAGATWAGATATRRGSRHA
jgi:anti-anti-sigma factor